MTDPVTHPPAHPRYRPRVRWFVIGGVLLLLAPVVFAGTLFTVLGPLFREDGVVPADGEAHVVEVAGGERRALFTSGGATVDCSVVDGSGADLALSGVGGEFTVNEWQAVATFPTGDGTLTLTCDGAGPVGDVRVGELPSTAVLVGGLAVGILVPLVLGTLGLVVLVVTGVRWATRPPRPRE